MSQISDTSASPAAMRETHAKRRVSRHGIVALALMLLPAILFPIGLGLLWSNPGFAWTHHLSQFPWELWAIGFFGVIATFGGAGDWLFHRSGQTSVGAREHRAHILALGAGGVPLFALMALASIARRPVVFLLPAIAVAIVTVIFICYDEFVFHRRCGRWESTLHRMLTIGNGLAWLAWAHWCFVRGGAHA